MALITKIEVSNFLNTSRIDSWDPSWKAHWPHVCMDFNGKNAIGRVDNGRGKTRLCNALFTILTRDKTLHAETKKLLAPSRKGISSHIRIEVKQQLTTGNELFEGGVEHYVMGLYGCYDTEVNFYIYQGQLSDCPVAFTRTEEGTSEIELVIDKRFKDSLKHQKGYQNRNRTEYLETIGLLFDMGFLQQQLSYQKSGGGDGTGNFFTLQNSHPKGQDFSTSFFYEHIAPHLLVDVMGSFAEEDENHFVDTLVKSSRKVISLEMRQEKAEQDRDAYNKLFEWLSSTKFFIDEYQDGKKQLHSQVNQLNHQLLMINRITSSQPLEHLASPVNCETLGENEISSQSIANQLSYHEGEWLISDSVLIQFMKISVSKINEIAHEKKIFPSKKKITQLIEISGDLARKKRPGGHDNCYYRRDQINALLSTFGESHINVEGGKLQLLRSINYGFDIREKLPSPNPIYDAIKQLNKEIEEQKRERKELTDENVQFANERTILHNSIERFELNQQAHMAMSDSGLFSADQLSEPAATKAVIRQRHQGIEDAYEELVDNNTKLSDYRTHYNAVKNQFGELNDYAFILNDLQTNSENLKKQKTVLEQQHTNIVVLLKGDRNNLAQLGEKIEKRQKRLSEMAIAMEDYKAVEAYYSDNELALKQELQAALKNELVAKSKELDNVNKHLEFVSISIGQLEAVSSDYQYVTSNFDCDNPQLFLRKKQQRTTELANEIGKSKTIKVQLDEKIDGMPAASKVTQRVLHYFDKNFSGVSLGNLAHYIDKRYVAINAQLLQLETQWCERFEWVSAIEQFESEYDTEINTVISSVDTEYRKKASLLERKKQELNSLNDQYERLKLNGEITPCNLVNEVHSELNFTGETVHQIICGIGLPEDRLAHILKEFSSVLHAPVVETQTQAIASLEQLIDAGMDYPVFHRGQLISYCNEIPNNSVLPPYESLHVKVLTDSGYLPELLTRLEKQISTLERKINDDEQVLQTISPISDHYVWLQHVKQAYDKDAQHNFISSCENLDEAHREHYHLSQMIASPEFLLINVAQAYQQLGGDTELDALFEQRIANKSSLIELTQEAETLNNILTEENITRFQNAIRFTTLGGDEKLSQLLIDNVESEKSQSGINEVLTQLKEKEVQCFVRLPGAQRFIQEGGVSVFQSLHAQITAAQNDHLSVGKLIASRELEEQTLNQKVSGLSEKFIYANGQLLEWKTPLKQAEQFILQNGPAFDKAYIAEKNRLKVEKELLERKLRFSFENAQSFIEVTRDKDYNNKLIQKIQSTNASITSNDTRIQKLSDDIEKNQDNKPEKETEARKYQEEYIKFKRTQSLASELFTYLQTELEITYEDSDLNSRTQYAIEIEKEIREIKDIDLTEIAELYLSLFDAVEGLGLEDANDEITDIKKSIDNQEAVINRTIKANLEKDKVVREAERQELYSDDINRVISTVNKLKPHIEQTAIDKDRIVERTAEDVKNQKQTLANNMVLLTNTLKDNLKLMKSSLGKGSGQAGFVLDANVVSDELIQKQIDKMIESVRIEEERFQSDLLNTNTLVSKTESQHIAQLQEKLKLEFNRSVFVGNDDRNNNLPSIKVIHPRITADRLIPLSLKFSVGQRAAIGLLLLVKIAAFNSERVNSASTMTRVKRSLIADKVVIIDGLFSNLSDEKMINDSLETVRNIKDDFQIIGWLHNPTYKNNFEIFPCFYNISPVNRQGILQANKIMHNEDTQMVSMTLQLQQEPHRV
jgi:hypothetical protein